MNDHAQAGVIVGIIIIFLLIFFFMFTSYGKEILSSLLQFSKPVLPSANSTTSVSTVPFSLTASLAQNSQIYVNQPFSILLTIKSLIPRQLNLEVYSFGCSFAQKNEEITLPAYGSDVSDWSFSSSAAQSCTIQFKVCFPYSTSFTFPFVFKSYNYNSPVPISSPIRNTSLVIISTNMPQILEASPSETNESYYIYITQNTTFGYIDNGELSSLTISSDLPSSSPIYISNPLGEGIATIYDGSPQQYYGAADQSFLSIPSTGTLQIPFLISTLPSGDLTNGYSSIYNITVDAQYTFCALSNYVQINVQ